MGKHALAETILADAPHIIDVNFVEHPLTQPAPVEAEVPADTEAFVEGLAHPEQVDLVAAAARTSLDAGVDEIRASMLVRHQENAESIDFWEGLSHGIAQEGSAVREAILNGIGPLWHNRSLDDANDPCDRALIRMVQDVHGSTDPYHVTRPDDVVNFTAGGDLVELIDSGAIQDGLTLEKATLTIHALIANGIYKFARWDSSVQLEAALSVMEQYAARVPGFNLEAAGFEAACVLLSSCRAALQADNMSKPNYAYARPERSNLFRVTNDGLNSLARAEAHGLIQQAEQGGALDELLTDAQSQVEAADSGGQHQYAGGHRKQ